MKNKAPVLSKQFLILLKVFKTLPKTPSTKRAKAEPVEARKQKTITRRGFLGYHR